MVWFQSGIFLNNREVSHPNPQIFFQFPDRDLRDSVFIFCPNSRSSLMFSSLLVVHTTITDKEGTLLPRMLLCMKQKLPAHYWPFNQIFPGPFCCVCHHNSSEAFLGTTMYNRHNWHLRIQRLNITWSSSIKHQGKKISTTNNSQATTGMKGIRPSESSKNVVRLSVLLSVFHNVRAM